jgi:anti-sigma regulatory factor (Ser/Thr protein kinase)/anti-anti-sigma regulatory factor
MDQPTPPPRSVAAPAPYGAAPATGERLACVVESGFPVAVLTVTGPMTVATVPELRRSVLACLVEQPAAVVLDLAGADLVEDVAGLVLPSLAQQATAWPGCPMVAHGAPPRTRAGLERLAVHRRVRLFPTRDEAYAHIAHCPVPARMVEALPATQEAGRPARALVREACLRWGLEPLVPRAEVVATELVANAVRHAGGDVRIAVSRLDRHLHIAVADGSPEPPRRRGPEPEPALGGRGLLVVDAYASSWGCTPAARGKVVWATLRVPGRTAGGPAR